MVKIISTSHFDSRYVQDAGLYGVAPLYPAATTTQERLEKKRTKERIRAALKYAANKQARKEARAAKRAADLGG